MSRSDCPIEAPTYQPVSCCAIAPADRVMAAAPSIAANHFLFIVCPLLPVDMVEFAPSCMRAMRSLKRRIYKSLCRGGIGPFWRIETRHSLLKSNDLAAILHALRELRP